MTVETRPIEVEPRTKTVGDVLRHAARIIEERGWVQGDMNLPNGSVCAFGAIVTALQDPDGLVRRVGLLVGAEDALDRLANGNLVVWNDTPGRTAAEVIAALRAAADEADR